MVAMAAPAQVGSSKSGSSLGTAVKMIDLGFLTEEEQEAIMKVLQRDAELKRSEEERVRHLPEKIDDDIQLKNMSGQWFYEAKSKRHKDKIHGTDIIRASLRRKPATIGELSSNRSDKMKNSWVNNVNKEAVVTPELFGIQEQPEEGEAESSPSSHASTVTLDRLQESSMKAAVSPAKQRKNPFNDSILPDDDNLKSRESGNGTAGLSWTPNEDSLSPSKDSQSKTKLLNSGSEEPRQTPTEPSDESQKPTDQPPVPKARKVICKITDPMMQKDASLPKPAKRTNQVNGASTPPRGILKRSSSSSSTDSEVLRVNQKSDAQNKNGVPTSAILEDVAEKNSPIEVAEDNSQNSLERLKQVRFSYSIGESEQLQSPPLHQGKEVGEFDLLEFDDKNSASNTDSNVTGRDILQENMLVLNSHDTEGSSLSATETPQPEKSSSAELMTPTAFSSKISVNGINVPTVSETSPNKSKPHLNPESELLKNAIDQPLPSAKTESPQVPRADLQQGKPALVEGQSAKTTSQPDKHIAEFMKAADESISKVLDWFKRSSSAGDDKTQSEKSQGREPKEEPDLPAKTVADNGEPCKDENKQPTREFSFGENGKSHSVLPRGLETEEKQMLKEKEKHNQNGEREETRYNEEACKEPKFLKDDKGQTGSKSFSSTGNLIEESLENDIQTNIKEEGENMSTVKPPLKEGNFTLQTGFDHKRRVELTSDEQSSEDEYLESSNTRFDITSKPKADEKLTKTFPSDGKAYKKESKEVKETKTEPSREDLMIQQQNQLSQRERTEKLTFKGSSTQEGQPAPWSLKMTSKGNAEAVEIVEKNDSKFNSGLQKLLKETSESSLPPYQPAGEKDARRARFFEKVMERSLRMSPSAQKEELFNREVKETIEKTVAAPKDVHKESKIGLEKLLKESEASYPLYQTTNEDENQNLKAVSDDNSRKDQQECNELLIDLSQETAETPWETESTATIYKDNVKPFDTSLEKLYGEPAEVLSPSHGKSGKNVSSQLKEHPDYSASSSYQPGEVNEMVTTTVQPKSDVVSVNLQPKQSVESVSQQDITYPQEENEIIEKAVAPSKAKFSEFNYGLEKLQKEASETSPASLGYLTSQQNINHLQEKLLKEASEIPPADLKSLDKDGTQPSQQENGCVQGVNETVGKTVVSAKPEYSTFNIHLEKLLKEASEVSSPLSKERDTVENAPEVSKPLGFRRASTPLEGIRRSSTSSEEELNPVLMALKRSADRKMPSKSLEDISSATPNTGKVDIPREELVLSAEDVSTVPSKPDNQFSNPEKVKRLSKSVPAFLQEEVSGSVMSIYSGDFGNVDVKGNIQFAIDYVEQLKELHIFICQCKDLAIADVKKQRSDPYVKSYLLPEKYKMGKRKTSVRKKTVNPVFNEILRYKIDKDLLKNQILNLSVWHNDIFGRNSFLGEVEVDLGTWDWNDRMKKQMNWFPLKPRTPTAALKLENRGEMKVALQYVPEPVGGKKTSPTGEVHIWVKGCNDLPLLRGNRLNSFVKCTILPDTSRKSRQKTRSVAKTTNPVFNHTMVYDGFRPEDLKEACVELTVWDHNKLVNHFLGGLRIGLGTGKSYGTEVDWMDSTLDEAALWDRMMKSPNTWVEDTLPLRMLMIAKLTE
ncbi:synaptotagmin-like protein 2 isoform B [Alligator mississippiensis]|uniref:Synaptotagmin-like protein 2 n=1 Tax=Alligator mississippiensis TaxID=8496 RepID=A0A151NM08_ALLMI|nr:synaptotagmin-like protein 2 isoform B [Alligator mississippiensis]